MLKRLKNIEGKNEQQLDLIRDQGDRQLDLIGKINADKTKAIEFYKGLDKKLSDLAKRAKKEDKENSFFLCVLIWRGIYLGIYIFKAIYLMAEYH